MVRDSSLFISFNRIHNGLAKAIYGYAHCCQDLLYFIPISDEIVGNTVIVKIRRNEISTSNAEPSYIEITFNGTTIKHEVPVDDLMYKSSLKLNSLPDMYSAMKFSSYTTYLRDTFGVDLITERCDVVHSVISESQIVTHATIDSKSLNSTTSRRMTQISATVADRVYSLNNNKPLIDSIIGLVKYSILNKSNINKHDSLMLSNYVYSSVCLHVKNVGKFDSSSSLEGLKLDLKIKFDSNQPNSTIIEAVNNNKFMPISTLHWLLYSDLVSINE